MVKGADLQQKGASRVTGGVERVDDGIEDLLQIVSFTTQFFFAPAVTAGTVEDREIEGSIRFKTDEQIEDLIPPLRMVDHRAIRLVDDDHRFEIVFESLLQDEAGLWHGPSESTSSTPSAIERTRSTATKVGVARGVDDVDGDRVVSPRFTSMAQFLARMVMLRSRSRLLSKIAMLASGESVQFLIAEHT